MHKEKDMKKTKLYVLGKDKDITLDMMKAGESAVKEAMVDYLGYMPEPVSLIFEEIEEEIEEFCVCDDETEECIVHDEIGKKIKEEEYRREMDALFSLIRVYLAKTGIDPTFMDWENFGYIDETEGGDITDLYYNECEKHHKFMEDARDD
jgi:hypothetical protein